MLHAARITSASLYLSTDAHRPSVGLMRRLAFAVDPHCVGPLASCSHRYQNFHHGFGGVPLT